MVITLWNRHVTCCNAHTVCNMIEKSHAWCKGHCVCYAVHGALVWQVLVMVPAHLLSKMTPPLLVKHIDLGTSNILAAEISYGHVCGSIKSWQLLGDACSLIHTHLFPQAWICACGQYTCKDIPMMQIQNLYQYPGVTSLLVQLPTIARF